MSSSPSSTHFRLPFEFVAPAPPSFPGLDHLKVYHESIKRCCARTAIRPNHRAGRVLEGLSIELQEKLGVLPREALDCEDGIDNILKHFSLLKGERPGDEERVAVREAMQDTVIHKGESLTDYVLRPDRQLLRAQHYGVSLPNKLKCQMLEEGREACILRV